MLYECMPTYVCDEKGCLGNELAVFRAGFLSSNTLSLSKSQVNLNSLWIFMLVVPFLLLNESAHGLAEEVVCSLAAFNCT